MDHKVDRYTKRQLKYGNLENKLLKIKNLHMCQIVLSSASVDEFSRE